MKKKIIRSLKSDLIKKLINSLKLRIFVLRTIIRTQITNFIITKIPLVKIKIVSGHDNTILCPFVLDDKVLEESFLLSPDYMHN